MTTLQRRLVATAICIVAVCLTVSPRLASAANGSVVYTYDALGRLTTASYDTGVCIIYTYDPAGNRTSQAIRISNTSSTGYWGCFNWNQANWGAN